MGDTPPPCPPDDNDHTWTPQEWESSHGCAHHSGERGLPFPNGQRAHWDRYGMSTTPRLKSTSCQIQWEKFPYESCGIMFRLMVSPSLTVAISVNALFPNLNRIQIEENIIISSLPSHSTAKKEISFSFAGCPLGDRESWIISLAGP